jgi:hypothetical protein
MRGKSLSLLLLLTLLGCDKNESKPETTQKKKDDDAAAKVEAIDPNLAQAVAAASVGKPGMAPPAAAEGGPPPDGVFAPGAADKELPKGGVPKITLGGEGADPKLLLGPNKSPGKLSGTVRIDMPTDPRQPPLPIALSITVDAKKAAEKATVAHDVTVRVTGAKIDATGMPKNADEEVGKLKGSKVEYGLTANGAATGFKVTVPKGAPEALARSLSEVLAMVTIPYPDKPLGVGGYFMVTSREDFLGLDLISYRMVKVKEVTPQGVMLEVLTRRYSPSRTLELPGMPPDMDKRMVQFQSVSQGGVMLPVGALLPTQGKLVSELAVQLSAAEPAQGPGIHLQTGAELDLK